MNKIKIFLNIFTSLDQLRITIECSQFYALGYPECCQSMENKRWVNKRCISDDGWLMDQGGIKEPGLYI